MLSARFNKHTLIFKQPGGTSRGPLYTKDSWYITISRHDHPERFGMGECSLIQGLSPDNIDLFKNELKTLCERINEYPEWVERRGALFPAIRFGLETALHDLAEGGNCFFGETDFTLGITGIPTNGLVWMGDATFMKKQIKQKLDAGFSCIKMKVGAIDFDEELEILSSVRKEFSKNQLEIRLDANGAFTMQQVFEKLKRLSDLEIHSIEQPIKPKQVDDLAHICRKSPIPIAIDEELIGVAEENIAQLLNRTKPDYIILKPSLLGGLHMAKKWIQHAESNHIGWWITSALESNIGLNAIAQWTFKNGNQLTQGLGTGQLFTNNIPSPLEMHQGRLFYNPALQWKKQLPD
jgi:o-succinylbenzoate synthase